MVVSEDGPAANLKDIKPLALPLRACQYSVTVRASSVPHGMGHVQDVSRQVRDSVRGGSFRERYTRCPLKVRQK